MKKEVQTILEDFSKIDKKLIPTNEDGGIKFPDFYEVPEVSEVITKLKKLNVTSEWLFKNGFVPAGMLFRL